MKTAPVLCFLTLLAAHGLRAADVANAADAAGLAFFEKNVRPILAENCYECHSNEKATTKGGLTLDSRDGMLKGGEEGPAVVPGNLEKSLMIHVVRYTDPEFAMPPKKKGGKLSDSNIATLEEWVKMGAPSPKGNGTKLTGLTEKAKQHWAFKPLQQVPLPEVKLKGWAKNPIDQFVLAKLEANGLQPNPSADPEAFLRRAFYDLIGLPPTSEQADAFIKAYDAAVLQDSVSARRGAVTNNADAVMAKQVDALLASPHYGERWARHWMDTARYSDTNGKLDVKDSFEEYRYAYAWTYRDYVIDAYNSDKPYNDFIVEQLAADKIPGISGDDPRLSALGFITVGKRFANNDDTIDERIDTTTKAFLGLTVACARCHDHKFDPIPAADYYSLHGIFASVKEPRDLPVIGVTQKTKTVRDDYLKRLDDLQAQSAAGYYKYIREVRTRYEKEMAGRLVLATVKRGSPEFGDISERYKLELQPDFEAMRIQRNSPITGPYAHLMAVPFAQFAARAPAAIKASLADAEHPVNPLIAAALRNLKPKSLDDVAAVYQKVFADNKLAIIAHIDRCAKLGHSSKDSDPAIAQLAGYPWPVPDVEDILDNEELLNMFNSRKFCADWQNRPIYGGLNNNRPNTYFQFTQINALRLTHPGAPASAMVVQDIDEPKDTNVYIRGDKNKKGALAPRRFLEILSGDGERRPFVDGSGRMELAQAIISKTNPITARVAVNRTWLMHFGEGFVSTPDDFGNMSEKPSHPELLDYLAHDFVENGWTLKRLHRLIVLSATYRQDSNPGQNPLVLRPGAVDPLKVDAGNRLLWRGNLRRLDFEAIRDSMIVLTGRLDSAVGGHPVNITDEPYSYRRSLYGYVDRRRLNEMLSQFDYSDPDATNSRRGSTIVPQQALFFMNNPLAIEVARTVASRPEILKGTSETQRITAMFRALFQRRPTNQEVKMAHDFLERQKSAPLLTVTPDVATKATKGSARYAKSGTPSKTAGKAVAAAASPMMMAGEGGADAPMMMAEVAGANLISGIKNVGEAISRKPLSPMELLAHSLLLSNEFVYVN